MLTILPHNDEKIISACNPQTDNATMFLSKNGENEIGHIVVEQIKSELNIIGFELYGCDDYDNLPPAQFVDADCLLRSAGSYALNRNVYYLNCSLEQFYALFKRLGFKENDNKLTINLQQLFKVCKN